MVAPRVKARGGTCSPWAAFVMLALLGRGVHAEARLGDPGGEGACSQVGDSDDLSNLQLPVRRDEANYTLQKQAPLAPAPASPTSASATTTQAPWGWTTDHGLSRWDGIQGGVEGALAWIQTAIDGGVNPDKEVLLDLLGQGISGLRLAAAYVLPPPWGNVAAGALAGVGGMVSMLSGGDSPPTNGEVLAEMEASFREVQARFDDVGEKLDTLLDLTHEMNERLIDLSADFKRYVVLGIEDVETVGEVAYQAAFLQRKATRENTDSARQELRTYLADWINRLRHNLSPGAPLSPGNVRKAFHQMVNIVYHNDTAKGYCEAHRIYDHLRGARNFLFEMMSTNSALKDPGSQEVIDMTFQLSNDSLNMTRAMVDFIEEKGQPVQQWLQRFEYPDPRGCERACVTDDCVIESQQFNHRCLQLGSDAAHSEAFLGNCGNATGVIYYPNGVVGKLAGRDEDGKPTVNSCLTRSENDVVVRPCDRSGKNGTNNNSLQWWDFDYGQGYLMPRSRVNDEMLCVRPKSPFTFGHGFLTLTIVQAKNLRDTDWWPGLTDAYVVCTIPRGLRGRFWARTRIVKDSLNPVWNQRFEWPDVNPDGELLRCSLLDEHFGSGQLLFSWNVSLDSSASDVTETFKHRKPGKPEEFEEVELRYTVTKCPTGLLVSGLPDQTEGLFESDLSLDRWFRTRWHNNPSQGGIPASIYFRPPGFWPQVAAWILDAGGRMYEGRRTAGTQCPSGRTNWLGGPISVQSVMLLEIGECTDAAKFALKGVGTEIP